MQVRRVASFPGVSAGEAEILDMAEETQRALYERAKASQEEAEREQVEEIDRGVRHVCGREIYPEEGVDPVSMVDPTGGEGRVLLLL
ncbi:MAG: hypothetical protein OXF02_04655 [Simkaniaceae bacterium]|nr:hypothetical protein [Simkaniaceae bacterium]